MALFEVISHSLTVAVKLIFFIWINFFSISIKLLALCQVDEQLVQVGHLGI